MESNISDTYSKVALRNDKRSSLGDLGSTSMFASQNFSHFLRAVG